MLIVEPPRSAFVAAALTAIIPIMAKARKTQTAIEIGCIFLRGVNIS